MTSKKITRCVCVSGPDELTITSNVQKAQKARGVTNGEDSDLKKIVYGILLIAAALTSFSLHYRTQREL